MNATEFHLPLTEYDFERHFDERFAIEWMQDNWKTSFLFGAVYVVLVFGGQHFMKERQKLDLRRVLMLWSLSLAIFRKLHFYNCNLKMLTKGGFDRFSPLLDTNLSPRCGYV
uniref:Elongation of very long chain fatty acids protein n=1 Tax=Cyprinus carpio TaxID=7962 RepID=A0A8C2FET4_CYPCA